MNVLGHEHVSHDRKVVALSYSFQVFFEYLIAVTIGQQGESSIATEGEEMEVRRLLITDEAFGHDEGSLVSLMGFVDRYIWLKTEDGRFDPPTLPQKARKNGAPSFVSG